MKRFHRLAVGAVATVVALAAPHAGRSPSSADPGAAVPAPAGLEVPDLVRVGLATDVEEIVLPCCGGDLVAEAGQTSVTVARTLTVRPATTARRSGTYRVQAAALKDEGQAVGLARRLAGLFSVPGDTVFDAALDLYRVRVGRFDDRAAAERLQRDLEGQGVRGSLVVSELVGPLPEGLVVLQGERRWEVPGRWLAVRSLQGEPVPIRGGRYRGRILVFLNDRGLLNLVNELSLEDYLRGVVPREMGPAIYDSLEALKAQAVAARSYAVRNLGEFVGEGYDLCATPRCQVYGGVDAEHELSDRAVRETAGEVVLWHGEIADSLYSSTCGGHTENVEVVFPLRSEPYLRGVACLESGLMELAGAVPADAPFPATLTRRLLPPAGPRLAPRMLAARLEHLAFLAGLPSPAVGLSSLDRREILRVVSALLDLAPDSELFVAEQDVAYLLGAPPEGWSAGELRLAAYLARLGILDGDLERPLGEPEIEPMLLELALFLRVLERREVRLVGLAAGHLEVQADGDRMIYRLDGSLGTYRERGGEVVGAPLGLLPGDRLTVYTRDGGLEALVHQADPDGVAFDRTSGLASWTRFRSDRRLRELVATRYPGFSLHELRVASRGISGRVGRLVLVEEGGEELVVEGLAVRWTLDLPDTLFTARRLVPPNRDAGWLFTGRGWGHGVGLCQVGAYGMGTRGRDYRDILHHYYSGVSLGRLVPVPRDRYERNRPAA